MAKRAFGGLSKWTDKELLEEQRSVPVGHMDYNEIQAEIDRRRTQRNQRYSLVNVISAVVVALGTIAGILYALDRGIYVGSSSQILPAGSFGKEDYVLKECRYLFVTGITEKPAHGGEFDFVPIPTYQGRQPINNASRLYCRFFGE